MTIHYIEKDITTVEDGLVAHGVNCSGVMNSGIAKAIRNKWPLTYQRFTLHPKGKDALGEADIIHIPEEDVVIANCYTQMFYGYDGGKYADTEAIKSSLRRVLQIADLMGYHVYIPKIGCGLGGLDWDKDVKPIIEDLTEPYKKIHIFVCDLPEK